MSDQENKQQGAESVEENTKSVKTESAETSVPESGATPPAEEKNAEGRDGKEKGHRRELQKAKEEIEKLKAEAEDFKRKWYSVTAEYDNYRRRTREEASKKYTEGRSDVVSSLFAIGDNLERALAACADEKTRQGVEMVLKSYKKVLEGENVEEIDPTGQPFDASFAEAIMAVAPEEGEEHGVVKQVYEKGYKRGDKVLRYAKVIVTQ